MATRKKKCKSTLLTISISISIWIIKLSGFKIASNLNLFIEQFSTGTNKNQDWNIVWQNSSNLQWFVTQNQNLGRMQLPQPENWKCFLSFMSIYMSQTWQNYHTCVLSDTYIKTKNNFNFFSMWKESKTNPVIVLIKEKKYWQCILWNTLITNASNKSCCLEEKV